MSHADPGMEYAQAWRHRAEELQREVDRYREALERIVISGRVPKEWRDYVRRVVDDVAVGGDPE